MNNLSFASYYSGGDVTSTPYIFSLSDYSFMSRWGRTVYVALFQKLRSSNHWKMSSIRARLRRRGRWIIRNDQTLGVLQNLGNTCFATNFICLQNKRIFKWWSQGRPTVVAITATEVAFLARKTPKTHLQGGENEMLQIPLSESDCGYLPWWRRVCSRYVFRTDKLRRDIRYGYLPHIEDFDTAA